MSKSVLMFAIATALLPISGAMQADALGSNCTQAALTLFDSWSGKLPGGVSNPVLVYERGAVRIVLDGAATLRTLEQRKLRVPGVRHAAEVIEERVRSAIDSGMTLHVDSLRPDLHALHGEPLRDGILQSHELEVLVLQSLLDGVSATTVAGVPVRAVRIERYEARDALGKVAGVRIVGAETKLFDYCMTDPSK